MPGVMKSILLAKYFPLLPFKVCVKAYREYINFKEYNRNFWPALKFVGTTYHSRLARPDWGHFPKKYTWLIRAFSK
jgi:hypothetical protein